MSDTIQGSFAQQHLSEKDFTRLAGFIHDEYGIKLPLAKKIMLESRLNKRLKLLKMSSFHDYVEFVLSHDGKEYELIHMIDLVTTNKTDFFREPVHFDYMVQNALPDLLSRRTDRNEIKLWSAGCSTGEEPYTLAMVLSEFAEKQPGFNFSILATDISNRVLTAAKNAIYDIEKVAPVSQSLKKKYLLKSKDKTKGHVRIKPILRNRIAFHRLNLMDSDYPVLTPVDIIFCRNVIIYFDRPTQEKLITRMCRYLKPGGYLFVGHSETLFSMNVPVRQVSPTIYGPL